MWTLSYFLYLVTFKADFISHGSLYLFIPRWYFKACSCLLRDQNVTDDRVIMHNLFVFLFLWMQAAAGSGFSTSVTSHKWKIVLL